MWPPIALAGHRVWLARASANRVTISWRGADEAHPRPESDETARCGCARRFAGLPCLGTGAAASAARRRGPGAATQRRATTERRAPATRAAGRADGVLRQLLRRATRGTGAVRNRGRGRHPDQRRPSLGTFAAHLIEVQRRKSVAAARRRR